MLAVPLAADLGLPRLRDVVGNAEGKVPVVLDRDKLHGDVGPAHAHLQEATPPCVAAVDGEASRRLQALDQALGGIGGRALALHLKGAVGNVLLSKFDVDCVDAWLWSCVVHLHMDRIRLSYQQRVQTAKGGSLCYFFSGFSEAEKNVVWYQSSKKITP